MLRLTLAVIGATFGWWLGILVGSTLGGAIGFLASPVAGRLIGGLLTGLIGGAIESATLARSRGKRLRFTTATALATALVALLLLDVQSMPWLVGGVFGAAVAAAQSMAIGLPRRDAVLRVLTSSAAWGFGFVVLHGGGSFGKLGVLAPGVAAILLFVASSPRLRLSGPCAFA